MISLGGNGVFNALRFLRLDFTSETLWRIIVPAGLYLCSLVILFAWLRRRGALGMRQLRWLEATFFGLTALYFVSENQMALFGVESWFITYAQRHSDEMSILARQPSIMWLVVIVAYGTFIPNTGRRCAVVTSAIAITPIVAITMMGRSAHIPPRALFLFLSEMTMWLAIGVALAVYGSNKIARLREEALEARKLGQYQLKRRLGQGGMGDVFLAEHMLLRRPCAVKVIRPEHTGNTDMLRRFLREVHLTATLTHPNTVQVFDYGQAADGTVFYAMEYLTGLNLDELVRAHGPVAASRTIAVLRQLCGALIEAHGVGLIHRDIKPSNVIVCSRGGVHDVVKLVDFGLARIQNVDPRAAGLTQAGLIFGTPAYMSPEQAAGAAALTPQSDLYSLGALAYFLLAGTPPFVRATVVQTLAAHLHETPLALRELRPDVPADLEAVVMKCLEKDPAARFSDAITLSRALDDCGAAGAWTPADAAAWWAQRPPVSVA